VICLWKIEPVVLSIFLTLILSILKKVLFVCESWFFLSVLDNNLSDWELVMQFAYMNIHVHIEEHIIELIDIDDTSSPRDGYVKVNAPNFKIMGAHLGITTLYVSSLLIYVN
jgi:hypothetical protein